MLENKKAENINAISEPRTTTRKIGNTTFIVSSRFSEAKERDPAAVIARLIQYDADQTDKTS